MKVFRPGLPAQFVDEPVQAEAPASTEPAPVRAKLTPGMALALADARHAQLTRTAPRLVETQPAPAPSPEAIVPAGTTEPVIPFVAALTATPVQPKPGAAPKVTSKPKPGTIPEHIRTGGGQSRTPAGQKK